MTETETAQLMTVQEAASRLRVSDRTIRNWLESGWIPSAYQLPSGTWRIPAEALAKIQNQATQDQDEKSLLLILSIPFLRAGVSPEFPMDETSVKRLCAMFGAKVDDRALERFASEQGKAPGGWSPTEVVLLLTWLDVEVVHGN